MAICRTQQRQALSRSCYREKSNVWCSDISAGIATHPSLLCRLCAPRWRGTVEWTWKSIAPLNSKSLHSFDSAKANLVRFNQLSRTHSSKSLGSRSVPCFGIIWLWMFDVGRWSSSSAFCLRYSSQQFPERFAQCPLSQREDRCSWRPDGPTRRCTV